MALITPVVHYCMGGLEISPQAQVLRAGVTSGEATAPSAIPGLSAAGEVAGGIHGRNRLGGNSLLDCVVFGRVAGASAARYLFDLAMEKPPQQPQVPQQAQQSGGGSLPASIAEESAKATAKLPDSSDADYADVPPEQRKLDPHAAGGAGDVPTTWPRAESDDAKRGGGAAFVAPGEGKGDSALPEVRAAEPGLDPRWPPVKGPGGAAAHVVESRAQAGATLTLEEVAKHNKPDDCWVILNGIAYDVSEVRSGAASRVLRAPLLTPLRPVHGRPPGRQEGHHGVRRPRRQRGVQRAAQYARADDAERVRRADCRASADPNVLEKYLEKSKHKGPVVAAHSKL